MANASQLWIYPNEPGRYYCTLNDFASKHLASIDLCDITSGQKSKMSVYLPEYDKYVPLCESTNTKLSYALTGTNSSISNYCFTESEWDELVNGGMTSLIIHVICDESTTQVFKLEKIDTVTDQLKTFTIYYKNFQVYYLGVLGEESDDTGNDNGGDDSGGDNGEGSVDMTHEKVYGICENKCKVEVLPKSNALSIDDFHLHEDQVMELITGLEDALSDLIDRVDILENKG